MAGSFSDFAKRAMLDALLSAQAIGISNVYVAACVGGVEITGNGYARVAVAANLTNFPAASGTGTVAKSNGTKISFPSANGGNWGLVNELRIYDAATGGNLLATGTPTTNKQIDAGDTLEVPVGGASFTIANAP